MNSVDPTWAIWLIQAYAIKQQQQPSQWETSLQSNAVSHCLGAYLKAALF